MIETPSDNLGADDEISMFMLENAWMGIPVVLRRYTIRREVNMCGITADQYSVSKSLWKGYERNDFTLDGREALIVNPITIADGNPWIWRTEFFDAFAQADMAMLEKGWHLAYYKVSDMYGSPEAIKLILKPGVGHNPHSLEDPTPIIEFILTEFNKVYSPYRKDK